MRSRITFIVLSFVLIGAVSLPAAQGTTKAAPKVAPKAALTLPPAIEAAFKAAYPKATIKHISKEKYAGKDAFEVESIDNGKTRDLVYKLDGSVAVIEEEITAADLPPAVAAAIKKAYPTATVTRYERGVEGGVTSYEVTLKGAKDKSAEFLTDGKRK